MICKGGNLLSPSPQLFNCIPSSLPFSKDVFTVSVGNLPPGASVLIKITYVAELTVEGEKIVFSLPGSVAPWKQEAALEETTQVCFHGNTVHVHVRVCLMWNCVHCILTFL